MKVEVFESLVVGEQNLKKRTIKVPKLEGIAVENMIFSLDDNIFEVDYTDIFVVVGYTEDGSIKLAIEDYLELKRCGKIKNDFMKIGYLKDDINFNIGIKKLNYFVPEKITLEYNGLDKIEEAIEFKRMGKYEEANNIYIEYYKKYGGSANLYKSMAKNYVCWMKYEEAIQMFKLANIGIFIECGDFDRDILYHLNWIQNRDKISEKEFLEYMKTTSGNKDYCFFNKI